MRKMRWLVVAAMVVGACKGDAKGESPVAGAGEPGPAKGALESGPTKARPEVPLLVAPLKPGEDAAKALGLPAAERDFGAPEVADVRVSELARTVMTEPGDIPRLKVAVDGKQLELPLEHTHVQAKLTGFVARVTVTQTYQNPFPEPIEAIYVFPLPENSAVDDMKLRVGDRLIEAEIKKREEARQEYEEAKRAGHTAALLEQERPNIFTQSVANIEPGKKIDVVIRYVQDLSYDAGTYEFVFPMVVGPRFIPGNPTDSTGAGWSKNTDQVADASRITPPIIGGGRRTGHDIGIEVTVDRSLPVMDLDVPTHDVQVSEVDGDFLVELADHDTLPNRDFVMRYRVDRDEPQVSVIAHKDKRGGFFSVVLQPPTADMDAVVGDRELVFVVDISGSMWGAPISMCKQAMQEAIRNLRPTDLFNVITFAGHTAKAFPESRPANQANVRLALDFVMNAQAGGGTNLADAVDAALSPAASAGRQRYVFFLTDGYVGNEAQIIAKTRAFTDAEAAAGRRSKVFSMGVGSSVNRYLLDGIADAGRGLTVYATNREDPSQAVNRFYHYVDHPVLTDVRLSWGDLAVADVYPTEMPDLFASRPLILHGRYTSAGAGTLVIEGMQGDKPVRLTAQVTLPERELTNEALETLWARARIDRVEQNLWFSQDQKYIDEITALGLDYRIVTAYTSFVAVDRSKKVGNGDPTTVVQPVEAAEGVAAPMAAPPAAFAHGAMPGGAGYGAGGSSMPVPTRAALREGPMKKVQAMAAGDAAALVVPDPSPEEEPREIGVRLVSVTVEKGTLGTAQARALVAARLATCSGCLGGAPGAGTITLRLVVDGSGTVSAVTEVETTLSQALATCIRDALKQPRAAALKGEVTLLVTLTVG